MFVIRFVVVVLAFACSLMAVQKADARSSNDARSTNAVRVRTVPQILARCNQHRSADFSTVVRGFYVQVFTGSAGPTADGAVFAVRHPGTIRYVPARSAALLTVRLQSPSRTFPRPGAWVILHGEVACRSGTFVVTSFRYNRGPR